MKPQGTTTEQFVWGSRGFRFDSQVGELFLGFDRPCQFDSFDSLMPVFGRYTTVDYSVMVSSEGDTEDRNEERVTLIDIQTDPHIGTEREDLP